MLPLAGEHSFYDRIRLFPEPRIYDLHPSLHCAGLGRAAAFPSVKDNGYFVGLALFVSGKNLYELLSLGLKVLVENADEVIAVYYY